MIKIERLNKKFEDNSIFSNYDIEINDGEFVAITGASGCGKSTLLNLIGALDEDFSGTVEVSGQNLKKLKGERRQRFIRENINYLFQNYALVENKTVLYNMMIALKYVRASEREKIEIIDDMLNQVGLIDKKNAKIFTLSGGEQQRVALARAIIKPGHIILADEPTGNLDTENRDIIFSLLRHHHKNNGITIIATHDMDIAKQCHRTIYLTSQ